LLPDLKTIGVIYTELITSFHLTLGFAGVLRIEGSMIKGFAAA